MEVGLGSTFQPDIHNMVALLCNSEIQGNKY